MPVPSETAPRPIKGGGHRLLIAVGVLLTSIIGAGGWYYYNREYNVARDAAINSIVTLSKLKAQSVVGWIKERRGDAEVARTSLIVKSVLNGNNAASSATAIKGFENFEQVYGYAAAILADAKGQVRLSVPADHKLQPAAIAEYIQTALHSRQVDFTDLHRSKPDEPSYLWLMCPVTNPATDAPDGALLLVVDPARIFFPELQNWPAPSRTGETLLILNRSGSIEYVNRQGSKPVETPKQAGDATRPTLSELAAQGREGRFDAVDDRGVPVCMALSRIPDTPWLLASKIDEEEIVASVRHEAWHVAVIAMLLVALTMLSLGFAWRQQNVLFMQRELEERQKASEAITLFRALIDRANDAIEVVDPQTARFLDVNSTAGRLHGYTREEYLALTVFDLDPNMTPSAWDAALVGLKQTGSMILETQHKRKDGSIFSIEINISYIRLQRDYILAVHRDITERKRTEQQIRRLNRVYAVLSSVSELILHERNPQAICESACKIAVDTGLFRMAWIGTANEEQNAVKPMASAGVVDGYLDTINIELKGDIRTKGPAAAALLEGRHQICNDIAHDTVMRPWREEALKRGYRACAGFPLKISDRTIGALVLYADEPNYFDSDETRLLDQLAGDIGFALESHQKEAERQRAEKDLRASEERFRLLIENSTDIITVVNRDGIIRFVSPTIKQYLGYEPRDLIGRSAFEFVDPQDADKTVDSLRAALEDPSVTANAEYRFRHRDGSWHIMQSSGRSIPNQAADGFVVINSRDITESRNLSEQLRQSQKMEAIGALAGGVAHDFNNLLTVINGRSELMLLRMDSSSPLRNDVSLIHQTGERAANLTRQLLAFSRRQMLQPRIIDLNQIVNDMFKMLNRLVPENISIATILEPELLATRADPGQIEQVLINLVVNARDAMPSGGKLQIETANLVCDEAYQAVHPAIPLNNYVTLSVSDTGCGMTEQVKARIFEPFFTTKEQGKGTGLGLATVFGIIQQSKGQISVQSEPSKGTTFVIYLPQQNDGDGQSSAVQSAVRIGRGETVVVAEDEKQVRTLVREVLESNGYRVLESTSGEECISICEQNRDVELVIAAEAMPKMNGPEFARNLRSVKPGIKLLVMAGNADHSQLKGFADLNAGSFIQKPFTAGVLIRKVSDILGP